MSISLSRYHTTQIGTDTPNTHLIQEPRLTMMIVILITASFWHVYLQFQGYEIGNQLSALKVKETDLLFKNQAIQEKINQQFHGCHLGLMSPSPQKIIHLKGIYS